MRINENNGNIVDKSGTIVDIKKTGLKATAPRMKILALFHEATDRHLSAEDVYRLLLKEQDEVGLATVYRVLLQFEQAGILLRNQFEGGSAVYELDRGQHHDHLVCLDCGRVEEFYDAKIEAQQQKVAHDRGFRIADHALSIYTHCIKDDCPHRAAAASSR